MPDMRPHSPWLLVLVAVAALPAACAAPAPAPAPPRARWVDDVDTTPVSAQAHGPATAAATDPVLPLDPRIRAGVLANGLRYFVLPHQQPKQRAELWLAIDAGSVQEDDDQLGLAHFVEHMAFNGTARFAKHEVTDYLQKIGMQFGADVNAYTSFDETVYQLMVPTDDPAFLTKGFDILRDWAQAIRFEPVEVEKERGVVLEEWRLGRGPWARAWDKTAPVLFAGTRYAVRDTIGKPAIIEGAPREALTRYYRDWYRPDLMSIIVVGDIDPAQMVKEIEARFADLARPATPRPRPTGGMPAPGLRVAIVTDDEEASVSLEVHRLRPHARESTRGDFRASYVVPALYSLMLNERLQDLVDRADSALVSAAIGTASMTREVDAVSLTAGVKQGRLQEALRVLMTEVIRVERHGFTASELTRAGRVMVRSIQQSARERAKEDMLVFAEELVRHALEAELMPGREVEAEMTAAMVPTVTLAELSAYASDLADDGHQVVLVSGPKTMQAPTEAEVRRWLGEATAAPTTPWVDAVAAVPLLATAPTPGPVVTEVLHGTVGVTEWILANGARVVFKPTDFAIDSVTMIGTSPGGTSVADDATFASARYATEIVERSGLGPHDDKTLRKLLAGKVVDVGAWVSEIGESVRATGSAEDLETMLQLVHLKMTAPRKDPEAFAAWRAQSLEWVRGLGVEPEQAYYLEMQKFLSADHPRRRQPTEASINKVDHDRALAFFRDRFGDAGDFTFVFVGDVDARTLRPLVERYLGSLPSAAVHAPWRDLGVRLRGGVRTQTVKRGVEPKAQVRMLFHGPDTWSKAAEIDAEILSQVLDLRLFDLLREEMSGVYGVSVGGGVSRRPIGWRTMSISFTCAPDAVAPLRAAVMREIERVERDGAPDDVLTKIRAGAVRSHELALRSDDYWIGRLVDAYTYGDDPNRIGQLEPTLERIDNTLIKAAARRFLARSSLHVGVLLPAKAAPAAAPGKPALAPAPAAAP
jgi:zinc protease